MLLAHLFDFQWLYNPDADNDYVFAFGHHDLEHAQRIAEQLVQQEHDQNVRDSDIDDPCTFAAIAAHHGQFFNDRWMADLDGVGSWITEDCDLEPEWKADCGHIEELCIGDDLLLLRDDWAAMVRENPARYDMAPIGPFPGTLVIVERCYAEDDEVEGAA